MLVLSRMTKRLSFPRDLRDLPRSGQLAAACLATLTTLPARADIYPATGIDLVTIIHTNNAPWAGNGTPDDEAVGRGSVGYEYRIGRMEVTIAQWTDFFNAAFDRPANDRIPFLTAPSFWGAVPTRPITSGGQEWLVPPGNDLRPVGNTSRRMAVIDGHWLNNGKSTNREGLLIRSNHFRSILIATVRCRALHI